MTGFRTSRARLARAFCLALAAGAIGLAAGAASAQTFQDSFAGLGANGNDPIQIEANELEVRDKEQVAILKGNVHVRQKNAVLKAERIRIYYDGRPGAGNQDISRLVAGGTVVVTSGDQTATGETAEFDMKAQRLVMTGSVVLSKGANVVTGERLEINLKTGEARFRGTSRVRMLIEPKSLKKN
ncbi:MAG: lipopolysaccharide transport periplasmic protein LptA [Hyphomicrobiales bacterium]|nr:MAG: lipopolysaccharide transport periplasmic protein LptA [Hyphomicrobiales bacterium]